jgi:hypothetical protein
VNTDAVQPSLPRFPIGCTPVEQASLWIPHPLYDWQYNTLVAAAEPYSRVAQSTCNESGKGLVLSTPIWMADGSKIAIRYIRVGDRIVGGDGKPCVVTGVFDQEMQPCVNIVLADGQSATCDLSHLWEVYIEGSKSVASCYDVKREFLRDTKIFIPTTRGARRIVRMEYASYQNTRCIKVDCHDETYIIEDGIITHNTSVVGPVFVLSVMTAFPGARVFATSASERQVKEQLFEANLRPIVEKWPNTWRVTKSQMKIEHINGSVFLAYVCSDPKDVEGFHSKWAIDPRTGLKRWEPCAYLIDEAKGVPDEVYQAVLRINPYFMIAMSSPGEQHGFLYDAISPDTLQQA